MVENKTNKIIENIPHLLSNPLIFSVTETEGLNLSGHGLSGFQNLHQKYCYLHNNTSNNQTIVILFQSQASGMPKVFELLLFHFLSLHSQLHVLESDAVKVKN